MFEWFKIYIYLLLTETTKWEACNTTETSLAPVSVLLKQMRQK